MRAEQANTPDNVAAASNRPTALRATAMPPIPPPSIRPEVWMQLKRPDTAQVALGDVQPSCTPIAPDAPARNG